MKSEMTERDKKLLIFLAVFVVLVGVSYWGIRPLIKSIKTLNTSISEQEDAKIENDYKSSLIDVMRVDQDYLIEELEQSREGFFDMMSSDEIDKYLTGVMLDHGLYCYDLSFSVDDTDSTLEEYAYSRKALEYAGYNDFYGDEDVETGIRKVSATMRVGGTPEQIQSLIDDLSVSSQKLLLQSYSWAAEQKVEYHENGTYDIVESRTLSISLELFMLTSEGE